MEIKKEKDNLEAILITRKYDISKFALLIVLVVMVVVLSLGAPYFFTIGNLFTILLSVTVIGIAAIGETIVLLSGGLDLSLEAVIAGTSVVLALLNKAGFPLAVSVFCGFLVGPLAGFINGVLISKLKINAVIVTLAMLSIIRGTALIISSGKTIPITRQDFLYIGAGYIWGPIPFIVIILISVYVLFYFLLKITRFGRNVYSVGGNEVACHLAGINVIKARLLIYITSGMLGSLSGIIFASMVASGLGYGANGMVLDIIAAVILGGTSLTGGVGTLQGTLIGVLILGVLRNGLVQLNVQSFWQMLVTGLVLIAAVGFDQLRIQTRK